jgi:hypothetical protein
MAIVAIEGAKALRHDLDRLATDVNGPLFNAMKRAGYHAVLPIVQEARQRIKAGRTTTRKSAQRLELSIRASGTKTGGAVRMGGKRYGVEYAGWIEFGGTRKRPHESSRDFVQSGRYLYPAAKDLAERAAKDYSDALTQLFGSSGIWTNVTGSPEAVHD